MLNEKNSITFFIILIGLFILFIFGLTFYQKKETTTLDTLSNLDLNPSEKKVESSEPQVAKWEEYNNSDYNFAINIPSGWSMEDYKAAYFSGGTLIAFSPNELPCNTCSYFNNGYFSIRIYNQQTDPSYFEGYIERVKQIGKNNDFKLVEVNGYKALSFANTITLENKGWVYELSLDINDGKSDISKSEIFQKVLASFQFNSLQFNQ